MSDEFPFFAFMVRVGRFMVTHNGVFWRKTQPTKNGKYTTTDYFCVFTGKREHKKVLERRNLGDAFKAGPP